MNEKFRRLSINPAVFLVYLAISLALTFPLVFQMGTSVFGDYGDSRGGIWWIWSGIKGYLDSNIDPLIGAPFGIPKGIQVQPLYEAFFFVPARHLGEVTAYNLVALLSFPLTAFATYLFLSWRLKNGFPAFIGGLIFGFCPAAVMQVTGGHIGYALGFGIPLLLSALFYNRSKRSVLSSLYVGASFAVITLMSLYFGYFLLYVGGFFFVYELLTCGGPKRKLLPNYLWCAFFAILFVMPFEYRAVLEQFTTGKEKLLAAGHMRSFGELIVYSARPWEYISPSIDHPVLGRFVEPFVRGHLHGSNVPEQTLYLGIVPLGLLITGVILATKKRFDAEHRKYFQFFAVGAVWMAFLSAPPYLPVGSIKIPTVSYFAYKIVPMFRVYARFGILVSFFTACAAAVVLAHLSFNMKRTKYYVMTGLLLPLLLFEYWSVPPFKALPVKDPPAVYEWLSKEPGDFIIAEYPMMNSIDLSFYTYLFWQRIHKKRMVNGATLGTEAWEFYERVKDLSAPEVPSLLKPAGVKYVVVHPAMYCDGVIPGPIKRYFSPGVSGETYNSGSAPDVPSGMRLYKFFGEDKVYVLE